MKKFYPLSLKKCRLFIALVYFLFGLCPNSILNAQTSVPFTTAGAGTWYCPAGVTSITVECWGAGGAGGGATGNPAAGGGGAGGAYTKAIIAVSPGTTYNLYVGAGSIGTTTAGASGESSWFNSNTTLLAIGGTGGALASSNSSSANGAAAPVSGNIGGTTNYYGGNGGKGSSGGSKGGGGGGSAGSASDGNDASTSTGGTAVTNGGAGANGSTSNGDGADATTVGGGGAGAHAGSNTNRNGGNGFTGKVTISYTTPGTYKDAFQSMSIGSSNWCAGETRTVTFTVKNTGTAAWVDAARQDINIGVKWDGDPDYLVRTDVGGLAAGAIGTYSFTVTAPATGGTNHLTFDVVYELVSWFAGNAGGVGPGNVVSQSSGLTINALPAITTQPSVSSQNLCKNSVATALSVAATGAGITYQWYSNTIASNSGGSIIPGATSANYTPSTTTVGTLYYYCIVSGTCTPAVNSNVSGAINVNPQPTATAGGSQTICQNGTAAVSGATSSNGTILWSHNGTGSLSNATTLTPTYTAAAGDASHTVTLTMTVSSSPCTAATATYSVIVNGLPTATAGGSQSICQSGTATVSGATSSNGTILWTHNGTGSLSNATTLTPTYTTAAGDIGNTVILTMTVTSNNTCTPATAAASYSVIVKTQPSAAAGGSQTICQNGTATVSGASSSNGTILWSHNGAGSLSNVTTLTPTYTAAAGDAGHTVTLTMTVSNNPCTAATANYSVIVNGLPTATAGGSQTICQSGTATVSGATSSNGTISWAHNGTGSLSNATTLTPTYTAATGDAGHTVTLTMTVTSSNVCSPATATATYSVLVKGTPTASAGGNQTICQNGTATVSGANSTYGTIAWTENGAGSITSGATTLTPTYTAAAGDAGNAVTLTMTVSNSPCAVATATYTVFVKAKPTASAGGSQTICQNGTATVSGASASNGTISWAENGSGSITSGATTLTPTYTAAAGDAGNTVTLTMTVSNSPCAIATATYSVIVKAQPTANAGTPLTMCSNSPIDITTGASVSNSTGVQWHTLGDGNFNDSTSLTGELYAPGPNDIATGSVTITLTATGNSPCGSATSSKIITITPAATANAGTTVNTCAGSGAVNITTGATAGNYTSVLWTKSGTGTLTNANSLTAATYIPSAADIAAGYVTLTLTVTGTSPCGNAVSTRILSIASAPTSLSVSPSTSLICVGSNVSLTASATTSSTTSIAAGSDNFNNTPQYSAAGNTSVFLGSSKIFTQENSGFNDFLVTTWNAPDGSKFMLATAADLFGSTTSTLTSPVINTTNYSALTLNFQHTYRPGNLGGSAQVQFSTDGGSTWTTVQSYSSSQGSGNNFVTVTIPAATLAAYINQTNLKIRFNYSSSVFFATSWWAIDNITLNGTPVPFFSWTASPAGATAGLPANAGTALASNKTITVTPTQTTVYTLTATDQTGSCTSSTATATVTVNQKSADPTSATASSSTICKGNSTILTLNGGGSGTGEVIHWYSGSCGGTAVGTGNNLTVSPVVTTTYYGRYEDGAPCNYTSACASVIITVNQKSVDPASATASSNTICNGGSTILTLNGGGGGTGEVIHWYSGSCGGTAVGTGNNLTVSPVVTTTYYGRYEDGAPCNYTSACASVIITVNQKSIDPVSATASSNTICNGGSTILTLNGGGGGTGEVIHWYSGSCGGSAVGTGNNLTVSPVVTTTYYGRFEDGAPCNYTSSCASIVITVNQPATAAISGDATICSGSATHITFVATPNTTVTYTVNGGSNQTIGIDASGTATISTGALFVSTTYALVNVGYTAPPGCIQAANGTSTVNVTSGTWLGFTADWNDPSNWCGGIPLPTTDVMISSGTPHDPVVSAATATAHNITIASGATLIVTGQTLKITGNITSNSQLDASNGTVELNGTAAQNISANTFVSNKVNDLIISNSTGVTLGGALDVYHSLTYGMNGATLSTGGYLTLKSTATKTAWIGDMTNHTINGDVTVERYIATGTGSAPNHGKSWQFLAVPTFGSQSIKASWQEGATASDIGSTPVSAGNPVPGYGTMITSNVANAATQPAPGFDVYTAAGPTVKVYDSLSTGYFGPASTAVPVYNQRGYFVFVRGDRSVYTSTGAANPTILRTKGTLFTPANLPPVSNVAANLFESVGNPYASAIDMRNIILTGGVTEFFQVWDPRLGGAYNYGAFQTFSFDGTNYKVTPGGGSYGPAGTVSNYIQSGQAFLVQAFGSNGTVSFSESCKAGSSSLFTTPNPVNQVVHTLRTSLNTLNSDGTIGSILDGVLSQFDNAFSNAIDGMDAHKSPNTGENLSIKTAGKLLVIERRQTVTRQDTIFLNISGERNQTYRFHFDAENLDPSVQGYLVDNYTNTRTPLNMTATTDVDFTVSAVTGANAANRFMIVFEPLKALPVTFTSIKAYKQDKAIDVEWTVDNEMNMKQYEVEKSTDGSQFTSIATKPATANNGGSAVYVAEDANPAEGFNYYRVKSLDINGKTSYTNVVKVIIGSIKQDITIYPNPITDGMIHLQLMNEPAGKYNIRLLNKLGQVILQKQIAHPGGNGTELLKWDYNLAHGIYQVQVTGPGNIVSTISVIY